MNIIKDVSKAGKILNTAKNELERPIVTSENYLDLTNKNFIDYK